MPRLTFLSLAACTVGALFGLSAARPALSAQTAVPQIWRGVYTADQAETGETTYAASCSRCHNPDLSGGQIGAQAAPALGGQNFMARWESNNVDRLFHTIRETMPRGTPGILNDQSALAVVAYILKFNGFPAGDTPLTVAPVLADLLFVPKDGAAVRREVGNFVVVQTVGCLAEGPSQSWTLTHATDPTVARPGAPLVGKDAQSGSQTFRLVSAGAYRSSLATGRAVQVKGVLRRDPEGSFINLTDVAVLGSACTN